MATLQKQSPLLLLRPVGELILVMLDVELRHSHHQPLLHLRHREVVDARPDLFEKKMKQFGGNEAIFGKIKYCGKMRQFEK